MDITNEIIPPHNTKPNLLISLHLVKSSVSFTNETNKYMIENAVNPIDNLIKMFLILFVFKFSFPATDK